MIKWIENLFQYFDRNRKKDTYREENLEGLEVIWKLLDADLQACAKDTFVLGKYPRRKHFILNEVGMAQLVQHLDKHGFEIKRKEQR
jgi:hypothetical protein